MKASIIIPTLNEADNIVESLKPLQVLRENKVEIILVDGGSVDATVNLAQPLVDKLIVTEPGRARQMNEGAKQSQSEFLFFLHADTLLSDNFCMCLDELDSASVRWGFFQLRLNASEWYFRVIESMINWRSSLSSIGTGDQVLFMRRDCFFEAGSYPDIPIMEDVAFAKRAKALFNRAAIQKQPVITSARRWQKHGTIKTIVLMWRLRWDFARGISPQVLAGRYRYD